MTSLWHSSSTLTYSRRTFEILIICVLIFLIIGINRIATLDANPPSTNQNTSSESQSYTKAVHPPLRDCTFLEGINYFLEGRSPAISKGSSMLPTLSSNYMIMEKNVSFSDLKTGDIIVFSAPSGEDEAIEHRIIFIDENLSGERVIVTQGDNNPEPIYGIDSPVTEHDYIAKDECVLNR